jgi:hypothetical protein
MRAPWNRNENADLERLLRASRPDPSRDLVDGVLGKLQGDARGRVRRTPRLALASIVTVAGLVVMAAFGGAGYAHSKASSVAHTFKSAIGYSSSQRGNSGYSTHHAAKKTYPNPGFYCASRGGKDRIKLILTQRRFDRLIARGWSIGDGPFSSHKAAKAACPSYHDDDGD